jgi:hypothetical protein
MRACQTTGGPHSTRWVVLSKVSAGFASALPGPSRTAGLATVKDLGVFGGHAGRHHASYAGACFAGGCERLLPPRFACAMDDR